MKKASIHYFTGTGNTAHAAGCLQKEMEKQGWQIKMLHVTQNLIPTSGNDDIHIFLFPVYALGVPHLMQKYMKKFAKGNPSRAAVIANHGMAGLKGGLETGYESQSLPQAARILKRRGFQVVFTGKLGYPENITVLADPLPEGIQSKIISRADEKIRDMAVKISDGTVCLRKYHLLDYTLGRLFSFVYQYLGRWQIGKLYCADGKCTSCGKCGKLCPAGAIRMVHGRPRWNWNCEGCLGCYNLCPSRSIQVSNVRLTADLGLTFGLIPLVIDAYQPLYMGLRPFLPMVLVQWTDNGIFKAAAGTALYILVFLVSLYLLDKLFFMLERTPFLKRLMAGSFTKGFKRYRAPGYKTDDK